MQAPRTRTTGPPRGALPAGDAPALLRFLRRGLPVQTHGAPASGGRMMEIVPSSLVVDVAPAEYHRLLGYPRDAVISERAQELADWARDWYRSHGRPWIYARRAASLNIANGEVGMLAGWQKDLARRSGQRDQQIEELNRMGEQWTGTRAAAEASEDTPETIRQTIQSTLDS